MCGIVGFISDKQEKGLIDKITQSISHRGPDEIRTSIYPISSGYLHLGSARLSITGLNDGSMPMENENGNVLVYNGEIYEIANLRSKYSLNTDSKSDTRHLLSILSNHKIEELNNLNGMFAFAYFDKENERIILGRDKLGIKPLYFGSNNTYRFYFSSEIKPLINHNIIENRISESSIKNYLYLGGLNSFEALFKELEVQEPGSFSEYRKDKLNKNIRFNAFYPSSLKNKGSTIEFVNSFSSALDDQLNAEVPVNILLSGGVDSTLIALFAKKYLKREVSAYSLGFKNQRYNEGDQAEMVANELGIELLKFQYPDDKNEQIIDDVISKIPEPIADPSIIPTYYLSKKVSEFTKVVITGDGADELFGGYEWYRGTLVSKYIPKNFSFLLNLLAKLKINSKGYISQQDKLRLLALGNNLPDLLKVLLWQNYIPSEDFKKQIDVYKEQILKHELSENFGRDDLRLLDIKNYLYTNILKKSDTASMLNGLEIRPVFLDERIVNFAMNIDNKSNFNLLDSKVFLKKILNNELKNYNFKKKHGFAHDFGDWTEKVGLKYLQEEWIEIEEVNRLFNYLKKNNENDYFISRNVWKFYSLFKWMDINKVKI
jgi:asparagine synthase (glutamine-hydrolysing)